MTAYGERMVTLPCGTVVYQAVVDAVHALVADGHTLDILDDEVIIRPPVDDDRTEWLSRQWSSVAAVLASDRLVH